MHRAPGIPSGMMTPLYIRVRHTGRRATTALALVGALSLHAASSVDAIALEFACACDASAAVALDERHIVAASDEENLLRIYRLDHPGPPVRVIDLSSFLAVQGKAREADLEAAARVGDRVYWISSHSRNADGKRRESRDCLFATRIGVAGPDWTIEPEGRPYRQLLDDLLADSRLARYDLRRAASRGPKDPGGFNIEGLSATPEGQLLIGFRNPIPNGRALIVPLLNPEEVILGARARLGPPLELELGGLGIRDFTLWDRQYVMVAGRYDGKEREQLFWWSGGSASPRPDRAAHLKGLNPEAVIAVPTAAGARVLLLSDDGSRKLDGRKCEDLKDSARRRFRAVWLDRLIR
ncbi:MAG: DUF3616 domain-containing protein [Verrucomicrobia bacterium]|nr:DUF3616 domain-containing protein [Verrucomicrobiota bacterium]